MAQPHAASAQVVSVRPLGDALRGARTTALLKAAQLEVVRLVLPAGKALPEHRVAGEITLQCIEGRVELALPTGTLVLDAGDWVHVRGGAPHALQAIVDASLLLTICLLPAAA
jgi:quercetin dioxygenase-like cupin family protein